MVLLLDPIMGHSRKVSYAKILLLGIALVLTATLIIFPVINGVNTKYRITFSGVEKGEGDLPTMVNPRFQGLDSKNQTYNIAADIAIQDTKDKMRLKKINAKITLNDGDWISLISKEGVFDHAKNTIDLKGDINVANKEGYLFKTEEAHADMEENYIYGDYPVSGNGPIGTIAADKFKVLDSGDRILLEGNVKVVFYPGRG